MKIAFALTAALLLAASAPAQSVWPQQKLTASDAGARDHFGASVDADADTVIIGAPLDGNPDMGSAYVFVRQGTTWVEQAKLTASDAGIDDDFGRSVAVHGDTVLVGTPFDDDGGNDSGAAYVFVRTGTTWTEEAKLVASDGGGLMGVAVAIDGDTALLGATTKNTPTGGAYVFVRSGTTWGEQAALSGSSLSFSAAFGRAVALSGDVALIGARFDNTTSGNVSGSVFFFRRSGTAWAEEQKINGPSSSDRLGWSVAIDGDAAIAGAPLAGVSFSKRFGLAQVYRYDGSGWSVEADLLPSDPGNDDQFGNAVSLSGDLALVASPFDDHNGEDSGSAYVFQGSGTVWSEQSKLTAVDDAQDDNFGLAVALAGSTALVGAQYDDDDGLNSGSAYLHEGLFPTTLGTYCTAGTSASGCQALIGAAGTPSASAQWGFALVVSGMEGAKNGLFFYGTNGKQANPWGNGGSYVCVVPPRLRGELLVAVGSTAGACDGVLFQDLNARWCPSCPKPSHNPGAGAVVTAQLWYRDPNNTSNVDTSMSDAIEFTVGP